jgi:hypothetical protein
MRERSSRATWAKSLGYRPITVSPKLFSVPDHALLPGQDVKTVDEVFQVWLPYPFHSGYRLTQCIR